MLLSVIIVNYNVQQFLEHCLLSVQKAMAGLDCEVIVVDNNSDDDSCRMIEEFFPFVKVIRNQQNTGFAKANNQAIAIAKGELVLFLNPDTIVPEDCFRTCIEMLKQSNRVGAIGVKMIDGSGAFLPESKRGFPSPWNAFTKMTGIAKLFPSSKILAGYYQGHLNANQTQVVDALSGAFMMVKRKLLQKTGGFDEQFFMYGEDLDLSYRIQQEGFQNLYFPHVVIIHFKGESTRRDKKYVRLFYKAMKQFVKKHFRGNPVSSRLLNLAISASALFGRFSRSVKSADPGNSVPAQSFRFIGDAESIAEARQINSVVNDDSVYRETVLCEGDSYSFTELIRTMELQRGIYWIHAKGSFTLIKSDNRITRGSAIVLHKSPANHA